MSTNRRDLQRSNLNPDYFCLPDETPDQRLDDVLTERSLTPDEARDVLESVLTAVAFLHQNQLVHSDIRPVNIVACGDRVKLTSGSIRPLPADDLGTRRALSAEIRRIGETVQKLMPPPGPFDDLALTCLAATENWWPTPTELLAALRGGRLPRPVRAAGAGQAMSGTWVSRLRLALPALAAVAALVVFWVIWRPGETIGTADDDLQTRGRAADGAAANTLTPDRDRREAARPTFGAADRPSPVAPEPQAARSLAPPEIAAQPPDRGAAATASDSARSSRARTETIPSPAPATPAPAASAPAQTARQSSTPESGSGAWGVVAAIYNNREAASKRAARISEVWKDRELEVLPKRDDARRYYVVIGKGMSKDDAEELRNAAVRKGLPRDSYVTKLNF